MMKNEKVSVLYSGTSYGTNELSTKIRYKI